MKDSRKTDIEGIDRHEYNFRVFMAFLKMNKIYFFKRVIFDDTKRNKHDFFYCLDNDHPFKYSGVFSNKLENEIDRRWSIIFNYVPYLRHFWSDTCIKKHCNQEEMYKIANSWKEYLYNNKFNQD